MIFYLISAVLTAIPLVKLLLHFGYKPYWAFAALIPFGPLVILWLMAIKLNKMEKL